MQPNYETIHHPNFSVLLLRTKRKKSISIKIKNNQVSMSVPKWLDNDEISRILEKKSQWVIQKLTEVKLENISQPHQFVDNEVFLYLGKKYYLSLKTHKKSAMDLHENNLVVTQTVRNNRLQNRQNMIKKWYQQKANHILSQRMEKYCQLMHVEYNYLKVRSYKSRWGSCSSKGVISFNWLLIMAPLEIIDYVVVHELCHLLEHNHSPSFWAQVAKFYPEYKTAKLWLKTHGSMLIF